MQFKGKTALVTGSGSIGGIGAAIAQELADNGASVVVAGRNVERGEAVVEKIRATGGDARFALVDMTDLASVEHLVEEAGHVDILVNNAGYAPLGNATDVTVEDFDRGFNTNVRGPYFLTAAVARNLIAAGTPGSIVNISSISAARAMPFMSAYGATKGAVETLTRYWANEFASAGIRVNAISPGTISSDNVMAMLGDATEGIVASTPLRRVGTPEEIAKAVVYLSSESAGFMTGSIVAIDGGSTAI
ncbi:SDR family oxidoreductase [Frondihabitans peucedani]|uniref:SDR family oxidoreductase n=1 Tax=Frondihabitans peucedani TaxID=598626 RepID=A0ABP8E1G9_9MICO